MGLIKYKLGDLIQQRREKYDGSEDLPVRGVSKDGFILPRQQDADKSVYSVFYRNDFVFNPARMELNSIALNTTFDKAICSSLYEIFFITKEDILLPDYLNMYIKRNEFARRCWFEAIGSARNYFRVPELSEFELNLPSLSIQQKYVDVYNSMLANQHSYEHGLEDLKLFYDAYIEELCRDIPSQKIGPFIQLSEERNDDGRCGPDDVRGVSIEKRFIPTKADISGVNLKSYYTIKPSEFAYVPVTSRNGGKISIALNVSEETYICSSSYIVFSVQKQDELWPAYLQMYFERGEFNRYARFNSWGSAREAFNFDDMCNVKVPVPDIKVQKAISDIYAVYIECKRINYRLKRHIKDLCPILIKGSLEEAE